MLEGRGSAALKTDGKVSEAAAVPVKPKSESIMPALKALVKSPVKKEAKISPKKEETVEVDIKFEEEEEAEKVKSAETSDHLVIFATEGEAVIKDVEKLGETPSSKSEKEEEGIQDVSVDEFEVEDSIMEQVNGDASVVEEKSNGVEPDLMENSEEKAVFKESKPVSDEVDNDRGESLKADAKKESEALDCIQEKES